MAESCSSIQNNHISWDNFLSDDLVILHCDKVESSIGIKQENVNPNPTANKPSESVENMNSDSDDSENDLQAELLDYCKNQQNPSTIAKTRRESNRFLSFVLDQGEHRKPEKLPPKTLDPLIGKFLKELKSEKTGQEYEPDTITSFHRYYHFL